MATIDLTKLSDGALVDMAVRLQPNTVAFWKEVLGQEVTSAREIHIALNGNGRIGDPTGPIWRNIEAELSRRGIRHHKQWLLERLDGKSAHIISGMEFKIDKVKGTASYDGVVLAVRDLDKIVENTITALATTGVFNKHFHISGSVECSLARDENDTRLWVTVGCKRFRADEALYVAQRLKELLK